MAGRGLWKTCTTILVLMTLTGSVLFFSPMLTLEASEIAVHLKTEEKQQNEKGSYVEELFAETDFSEVDRLMEELFAEEKKRVTFSDIVEQFLKEDGGEMEFAKLFSWGKDELFFEIERNRKLLVEILLLAAGFSVLRNFSSAFRSAYIADLCFLLVYCVMAVLLLQSFLPFRSIVTEVLEHSVSFMQALVPIFTVTLIASKSAAASAGFYQLAFLIIYLVEWVFLKVLLPCIHMYVILEVFHHFFEDEKFQNLTELLKNFICWGMKIAGGIVLGLNVVQGMTAPAKDRLANGALNKAAGAIPGIGNAIGSVSELLLGAGILLKNCVGAAAVVVLVCIGFVPMLKIGCLTFFYQLSAAVAEPVSDKRIAGCLKGMAEGGMLYLKLIVYGLSFFFLTIALTTAASSFIY